MEPRTAFTPLKRPHLSIPQPLGEIFFIIQAAILKVKVYFFMNLPLCRAKCQCSVWAWIQKRAESQDSFGRIRYGLDKNTSVSDYVSRDKEECGGRLV